MGFASRSDTGLDLFPGLLRHDSHRVRYPASGRACEGAVQPQAERHASSPVERSGQQQALHFPVRVPDRRHRIGRPAAGAAAADTDGSTENGLVAAQFTPWASLIAGLLVVLFTGSRPSTWPSPLGPERKLILRLVRFFHFFRAKAIVGMVLLAAALETGVYVIAMSPIVGVAPLAGFRQRPRRGRSQNGQHHSGSGLYSSRSSCSHQ